MTISYHFTTILTSLELKVTEKLGEVGFVLSSAVDLDNLHKGVIMSAYINQDS